MSIAGEVSRIKGNIASAYKALEALDADIPSQRNSANLRGAINSIPPDGPQYAAVFYDYDGTVTHAFNTTAINSLSELPEPPSHSGLRFTGWNWSLNDIKNAVNTFGKRVNIGARYVTSDGKTRLYIRFEDQETEFTLRVTQSDADATEIDWGDGSAPEKFDTVIQSYSDKYIYEAAHTYSPASYPAEYTITITPLGSDGYGFGPSSVSSGGALRRIEIGENVSMTEKAFSNLRGLRSVAWNYPYVSRDMFSGCYNLRYLTLGTYIGQYAFFYCIQLESISAAPGCRSIDYGAFHDCIGLKYAGVFPSCTAIADSAFNWCYSLKYIGGFPGCTSVGYNSFSNCINLNEIIPAERLGSSSFNNNYTRKRIVIPNTVKQINNGAFKDQHLLREVDLTDYTDPNDLPVLRSSFTNVFTTMGYSNSIRIKFYVANEDMKTAFSNATNWSQGAQYYLVKTGEAV